MFEWYLARRLGLMGTNDVGEALVDCITENCRDDNNAQMRNVGHFYQGLDQ